MGTEVLEISLRYHRNQKSLAWLNKLAVGCVEDRILQLDGLPPDQRRELFAEMKQRFTTSDTFLAAKVLEEGFLKEEERSLMQWIKMRRIQEDRDVAQVKRDLVFLGTRISNSLSCLLYMMLQEEIESFDKKFRQLEFIITFMASLKDVNSGIGLAYSMLLPIFSKFEGMQKGLNHRSSWYGTEQNLKDVLTRFQTAMATMDKLVSFPLLHEQMVSYAGSDLRKLVPIVGDLERIVNEMRGEFSIEIQVALDAVNEFLQIDRAVIVQRWNDFIISDGESEQTWLLKLKKDSEERVAKRMKTGDASEIDEEAALFIDAERRLQKYKKDFFGKMKEVLRTNRIVHSTALAVDFGQFHVGALASIKSCQESTHEAPVRKDYVSRMRKHTWPNSQLKAYDSRLFWMRGFNAVSNKKSVLQLLQAGEGEQPLPQSKLEMDKLEEKKTQMKYLIEYAIDLGIQLSKYVWKLTGMLMLSGVAEMHVRIKNLRDLFTFLRELYTDSGPADAGVVYDRIMTLMDRTLHIVRSAEVNLPHPHPYTEWAEEFEVKIDSLLDDLVISLAMMETLLTFPMMLPSSTPHKLTDMNRVYFWNVEEVVNSLWGRIKVKKVVDGVETDEMVEEAVLIEPRVEGLVRT